ncbi:hypothetical protein K431DRAFT_169543 [Polychaeton citri CBS 116435]|uniref:Secreted protein n=1 Tax=Polychaeton citri CBS 116435 TaxID=1314669 RepID=A0A9P4Q1R3_9PEZI|nr:hypothetical protein K431DRAFT_169543 [Polychaeton citri CBS 116435]
MCFTCYGCSCWLRFVAGQHRVSLCDATAVVSCWQQIAADRTLSAPAMVLSCLMFPAYNAAQLPYTTVCRVKAATRQQRSGCLE